MPFNGIFSFCFNIALTLRLLNLITFALSKLTLNQIEKNEIFYNYNINY